MIKDITKSQQTILVFITAVLLSFSIQVQANEQLYRSYQAKQAEMSKVNEELDLAKISHQSAEIELDGAISRLDSLRADVIVEKSKLDKLRDFEDQNPDLDISVQINEQRAAWKKANQEHLSNKEYVESLNIKVNEYKTNYNLATNKKNNLEISINRLSGQLVDGQVNERLKQIQVAKRIKVKVRETCSLSVTKDECRDQARVKAERQAAEQGSLVVVESVTEIKNFNLTKDEARSRVSARVSDIRIVQDTFDLTSDKSAWQVDYEISALVTPVVTPKMREELKRQAIAGLNLGYVAPGSAGSAQPSSTQSAADKAANQRRIDKEQQRKQAEAAQKQLESETLARQKTEEELELIRQRAIRKAEQEALQESVKEEKVAEEAKKSRKRKVFGAW